MFSIKEKKTGGGRIYLFFNDKNKITLADGKITSERNKANFKISFLFNQIYYEMIN